jgi:phosphate transport system substrate-binding protein
MAEDLDYIPMPNAVVGLVKKMWSADIKDASGKPLMALSN